MRLLTTLNVIINLFSIIFVINSLSFLNYIKIYFIRFIFVNILFVKRIKFDKINIFKKNRENNFF